jgi:hypothetical protein
VTHWKTESIKLNSKDASELFNSQLALFKRIEFAQINPYSFSTPLSARNTKDSSPLMFDVLARMDIRGIGKNAERIHERGILQMHIVKNDNGEWKITSLDLKESESLKKMKPTFKEKDLFVDTKPSNFLRKEAIRRGGYALSLTDLNNDGHLDMLVGHLGPLEIFLGNKNKTFSKVSPSMIGLGEETLVKSAIVTDFDNDGLKDILLVRFAPREQNGRDLSLYKNLGGKFKKATHISNRHPAYYAMPAAVADFSENGLLDFYVGFPGAKDFTVLNRSEHGFTGSKEFHPQGLFYNTGAFNFDEVTKYKLTEGPKKNVYGKDYPEVALIYPHSSVGMDYNLDGHMDIVVIDDRANLSPLYKNNGKGSFDQVADKIGLTNYDFGMGFSFADLDGDQKFEFIYSNVNFLASERIHNGMVKNFSDHSRQPGTLGLRVFKTHDHKNYADASALFGLNQCGEGIGGVEIIDYNNDGLPDVYVTNGLWSGNRRDQDLGSIFSRSYATHNFDFQEVLGSTGIEEANTSFMRILTGFNGEVESQIKNPSIYPSMAGFQRNCLFRNNGDGTMTEVGYLEGVDSESDGYIVGTADIDQNGTMDLVLRNGDPGTDKNIFPAIQIYLNRTKNSKSTILSFQGKKSNRDAIGVTAIAQIGTKKYLRHLIANNGASQSESILHFGLGNHDKITELEVRWPSGIVQKIKNISSGRHLIREPDSAVKVSKMNR